jgi:ferrous iron transport protein B
MNMTVALIGNPNCGKTTLFNGLTGARQQVGNWPGVTVDKKTGTCRHEGQTVEVVDLPGLLPERQFGR